MVPANVLATMHPLPHRVPVFSAVRAPAEGTRRWTLAVVVALGVQAGVISVVAWSAGHGPSLPLRSERPEVEVVFQAAVPHPAPAPAPAAPTPERTRAARVAAPTEHVVAPPPVAAPVALPELPAPSENVGMNDFALVTGTGESAAPSAQGASVGPVDSESAPAARGGISAPGGKGSSGDGEDLDAYGSKLSRAVTAHKRYPAQARRLRLEGTVIVEVDVARDGTLSGAPVVSRSSGHAMLDEEALRMVRAAAPFAALPPGLAGATVHFVLPIRFGIRDAVSP